jgi:hypothetical protein
MFRLVSVFVLIGFAVVAASLLDAQKSQADSQPRDLDRNLDLHNRCLRLTAGRVVPFHVQFSLN